MPFRHEPKIYKLNVKKPMTFLPKGYDGVPDAPSNYMKFEEGQNRFRVLSDAIVGYQWWTEDDKGRKPHRVMGWDDVPEEFKDGKERAKHFWAFAVYNKNVKRIQILEIMQASVLRFMESVITSEDWGDPKEYDITVTKTKTGSRTMDVEYSLMPNPKKEVEEEISKKFKQMKIDLNKLYKGEDPFGKSEKKSETEDFPNVENMPDGSEDIDPDEIPL